MALVMSLVGCGSLSMFLIECWSFILMCLDLYSYLFIVHFHWKTEPFGSRN